MQLNCLTAVVIPRHRNALLCCRPTAAATSTLLRVEYNALLSAAHEAPPPHCWLPSNHHHPSDQAKYTSLSVSK